MPVSHSSQPAAVTIGAFDGVHRGHAALLRAGRNAVGPRGRIIALAFDPHPLTVLRPTAVPARLTTFEQRTRLLLQAGADEVVRLQPTPEVLQQTPDAFIEWCVRQWQPSAIVEGPDFRFGRARAGSIDTLRDLESRFGYRTIIVEAEDIALADQTLVRASSSLVRWLLERGRVQDAAAVVGRPYEIQANVVAGDKRGRTIGFPTANLDEVQQMLPADGIYAGIARGDAQREWLAAISVGTKPTFGQNPRTCEAFLLDYDGAVDEYGWEIAVRFTHWLRDQLTFASIDGLIEQLHRDIAEVRLCAQRPNVVRPGLWRCAP
jgi:riboflavin kinase / FMN adenylyltransferase